MNGRNERGRSRDSRPRPQPLNPVEVDKLLIIIDRQIHKSVEEIMAAQTVGDTVAADRIMADANGFLQVMCNQTFAKAINHSKQVISSNFLEAALESMRAGGDHSFAHMALIGPNRIFNYYYNSDDCPIEVVRDNRTNGGFVEASTIVLRHRQARPSRQRHRRDEKNHEEVETD